MPTPKKGYYLDGKRVPSVTTILKDHKPSGGLVHWAWDLGIQGIDYRDVQSEATGIGSVVHAMVEASLSGDEKVKAEAAAALLALSDEDADRAKQGFGAYQEWADRFELRVVAQEVQLVSKEYRFGGTPDAIGRTRKKLALLDWKTSNRVYADYLVQISAYKYLWEENHPDQPLEDGAHLLRFSKDFGNFAHFWFTPENLEIGWRQFRRFRAAYEDAKILDKIVG